MKTQTWILDNRLYYTRKIELHRKGKKSCTVRITLIVICPSGSEISILITVRRVHYSKMGKVPTTQIWWATLGEYQLSSASYNLVRLVIFMTSIKVSRLSWGCRIHWLFLSRGAILPQISVLDMTLNNQIVRLQLCWSFGECRVLLYYCFDI